MPTAIKYETTLKNLILIRSISRTATLLLGALINYRWSGLHQRSRYCYDFAEPLVLRSPGVASNSSWMPQSQTVLLASYIGAAFHVIGLACPHQTFEQIYRGEKRGEGFLVA